MKTSLGIWAFGPMVTRFVAGGYQPRWAAESTIERLQRAVDGLGDRIDGYEFHYPQELNEETLTEVREAFFTFFKGGATAFEAGRRVGAIGVSGLPGEDDDRIAGEAIARAGLALE